MNRTLKIHSVHIKINEEQFEYLSTKGNKSEYMRELIEKDMQGGNDSTILLEALRLVVLKSSEVLPVVKPVIVEKTVQVERTEELLQGNGNLLDQFGWDD